MRSFARALGALVLLCAAPAGAVPLVLGDNVLPGTTAADRPELVGTVIADRFVDYAFAFEGRNLSGAVQQSVVRSDLDGTLAFTWRILPDSNGTLPVVGFRLAGFGDFINDGDWLRDSLGDVAPTLARKFDGGFVNFLFDDPVGPKLDQSSHIFFLKTTATRFDSHGSYDVLCATVGACITPTYATFAPLAGVPEPASWALMILGFGAAGAAMRRRAGLRQAATG
ncbi:MAG TPA: PEPxxWA-CTERM sorting domain-containing protein [Phenylobacterium sp.]